MQRANDSPGEGGPGQLRARRRGRRDRRRVGGCWAQAWPPQRRHLLLTEMLGLRSVICNLFGIVQSAGAEA